MPQKRVAAGKDEDGNATTSLALDMDAIQSMKVLPEANAARLGSQLLAIDGLSPDLKATPTASHTALELSNADGKLTGRFPLDTAISYGLTLNGLPVTGQGAKIRIAFAGDGSVTQLSDNIRCCGAARSCRSSRRPRRQAVHGALRRRRQAAGADARLPVPGDRRRQDDLPDLHVQPRVEHRRAGQPPDPGDRRRRAAGQAQRDMKGGEVIGDASVTGGVAPYTYKWSSSTAVIGASATRTSTTSRPA